MEEGEFVEESEQAGGGSGEVRDRSLADGPPELGRHH
jgi:hypothetical protein